MKLSHVGDAIKNISDRSWEGNYAHWNKLLSDIYVTSSKKIKEYFESAVWKLIKVAESSKKRVVFWGCGINAERCFPYFVNSGIMPIFFDSNAKIELNEKYERVEKTDLMCGLGRYFVVVTPETPRVQASISYELDVAGYRLNYGYVVIPKLSVLWYY